MIRYRVQEGSDKIILGARATGRSNAGRGDSGGILKGPLGEASSYRRYSRSPIYWMGSVPIFRSSISRASFRSALREKQEGDRQ